jgi:ATP:cob(I)alamin adenosyltransferase
MKVYTKTGDQGQTSLLSKQRVSKDDVRVDAYGTVDEANAAMGLAKSLVNKPWVSAMLQQIQTDLIALNADLATDAAMDESQYRITESHVAKLESLIDALEQRRIPQKYFVTPGICSASATLDLARTIVRRAERCVIRLKRTGEVTVPVSLYLNRLSDLLFVLARCVEQEEIVAAVTSKVLAMLHGDEKRNSIGEDEPRMLARAKKVIAAAEQKAVEIGVPMVIAVVDIGGNLVAQHRMDDSLLASISLALDKAYTAVALKMPTDQAAALSIPGKELFGLNTAAGGRLIVFGGGLPLIVAGAVIGGVGVSGGSVEEDMQVAKAGLAAW